MPARPHSPGSLLADLPAGSRLLIIRLRSLGDSLLTTPALRALKQWRPDLHLSVLLYPRFAPALAANPDVEEVIDFNPSGAAAPVAVARVLAKVRRRHFAACFNLHGGTLSALLTRLSGAPHRVAFAHFRFPSAYTTLTPDPRTILGRERLHNVERLISLFYWVGLPQGEIPPLTVVPQPAARAAVAQMLAAHGIPPGKRYAVLHPIANFFTKEWPFERYAELARILEREHGLCPVFTCGPGEAVKLDAVARAYGRELVRFDSLRLPELVALIGDASLFVGNDSGPAHIAGALAVPVVVLFGSSDSVAWGPWRTSHVVVQNDYPCNPCRGNRCYAFAQPECILSISVEEVRVAVERLLASVPSPVARSG